MDDQTILNLAKINLGLSTTAYDQYLTMLIAAAKAAIIEEGIELDLTAEQDDNLVIMYTAYLWRKRKEDVGMTRMLRYALNNRLLSQQGGAVNG